MHQHLGSLYLFAQCRSRVQFINVLMALLDYYSNKKMGKFQSIMSYFFDIILVLPSLLVFFKFLEQG